MNGKIGTCRICKRKGVVLVNDGVCGKCVWG